MPSPRIAQRCAKFHRAPVTWERAFFLTRFAAGGVVTECSQMAGWRLSVVVAAYDTSTILSPAFRAVESCLWSAATKISGSTASAHAT